MGQYQRKGGKCMKIVEQIIDNVGGLKALYLLPRADVTRIDANASTGHVVPVMRTRDNIIKVDVFDPNEFQFQEDMTIEDGGAQFAVSITGVIKGMRNLCQVREMENGEWLAVHQDVNGTILLSGTKDIPLRFVTSKASGASASRNSVAFTLHSIQTEGSRVCEGEINEQ